MLSVVKWRFNNRKRCYPQAFLEPVCASFLFTHLAEDLKAGTFPRGQMLGYWGCKDLVTSQKALSRPYATSKGEKWRHKDSTVQKHAGWMQLSWQGIAWKGGVLILQIPKTCYHGCPAESFVAGLYRITSIFINALEGMYCFFCKVSNEDSENCYSVWENRGNFV